MFTTRSSTLLILAALALFLGLLRPNERVALLGLAILFWLALQWIGLLWATRSLTGIVSDCTREIDGKSQERITLAIDQVVLATVKGKLAKSLRGYRISIHDVMPGACEIEEGFNEFSLDSLGEQTFTLNYRMKPVACGHVALPGIVVSISDSNGLFQNQQFVPLPQRVTTLPFLIRPQTTVSVLKHNNLQRILGHHRHKTAGISAELLGIRDYRPGDPPRTIAWKPTARLGKLMSREFESEVPIRTTIFADLASYQFKGRPGPATADRVITTVASVARLLLSDRDPVASVLATEYGGMRIPHGHGERQMSRMLHQLLVVADPNPRLENLTDDKLLKAVFLNSFQRFPDLYDRRVSFMPIGRTMLHPIRSRAHRRRCRMAPVLAALLNKPLGAEFRFVNDKEYMRKTCLQYSQKFTVTEVPNRAATDLQVEEARHQAASQLCARLADARARAKDNELFVVAGCLPRNNDDLQRWMDVLRACLATGHRVIFVDVGATIPAASIQDPVAREAMFAADLQLEKQATGWIRKQFSSIGVVYARMDDPKLMRQVAMEIELLRSGKSRSGGSRSFRGVAR